MAKVSVKKTLKQFSRIWPRFAVRNTLTIILVAALVVAAYFIGNLRAKVEYLKEKSAAGASLAQGAARRPNVLAARAPDLRNRDHIRGERDTKVILIEYGDLECPFCKRFHSTLQQVKSAYGSDLAWVYRHYPLNFHENAQKEAEASECAAELGGEDKFWEYIDKIYERTTSNGRGFALSSLVPLAGEIGISQPKFGECLDSSRYAKLVADQATDARNAGVSGTPGTFLVTGTSSKLITGALPVAEMKSAIDEAMKK